MWVSGMEAKEETGPEVDSSSRTGHLAVGSASSRSGQPHWALFLPSNQGALMRRPSES